MKPWTMISTLFFGFLFALGVFIDTPALGAAPIWAPPPLADLIQEGVDQNFSLKDQAAKAEGLRSEALAAGALDDPMMGFGLANLPLDTFSFKQEPMTQKQVLLSQKFPWPGKLSLRQQYAALKGAREDGVYLGKKLNLSRMIAETYYDLCFVNRSIEINGQLTDMVRRLLNTSESRYAVGKGLQQDVLQGQVELSTLLDVLLTLAVGGVVGKLLDDVQ